MTNRKRGDVVKHLLKFPVVICEGCGDNIESAIPQDIEIGFNKAGAETVYGLCPKCGRGYPMIEPVVGVVAEEKVVEDKDDEIDSKPYLELRSLAKQLELSSKGKAKELRAAIRAKWAEMDAEEVSNGGTENTDVQG